MLAHEGMDKNYSAWQQRKSLLHHKAAAPLFKQREVWWCSIGVNIGHEEDGKSDRFTRPVLIIRKFNAQLFLGVPLTTQVKPNPFYYPIHFHDKEQCIMLSQLRLWDSRRLSNRLGWLPKDQFDEIRKAIRDMI